MQDSGAYIRDRLQDLCIEIEETRMEGVPILNAALSVAAFGFEPWQDYHLGVLLTPWFMNLILVPQEQDAFLPTAPSVGEKIQIALPAGHVEFIVGYEEGFGHSLSCSLFSPVFEFEDQAAAVETAEAALAEVLKPANDDEAEDADMRGIWAGRLPKPDPVEPDAPALNVPKEVNRRDFLRGGRGPEQETTDAQP
ncbi:[NiFe]-hydrogenase assembly chaperone HybE [Sulfitobacter pacificus]|uniref:[NiFe]-hydrogenase assembly chaperone HybE n=1 Tax=Sulfitobacter pacificus TaxID=1499314 RepID=UPI00310374DA